MRSLFCERAIEDALKYKKAILKVISPNDVGATGGHQRGYYLPKEVWHLFTTQEPLRGMNHHHSVQVTWQDGKVTDSNVIWYGKAKSEYRLTKFGRDFPYLDDDNVGNLLVLIPKTLIDFYAYVLDNDDDIEEIQSALGVELIKNWVAYQEGVAIEETEDICLNRKFREFVAGIQEIPPGIVFSSTTKEALIDCVNGFLEFSPDDQLVYLIDQEYTLFKMAERKVFQSEVTRVFRDIDDFIETAMSILQSRRARAGRSLENHVEFLLRQAGIPYEMRRYVDKTEPDIIIPDKLSYDDPYFPENKLFMVALKMTCKDRWRQVTREAPRIKHKHIITMQKGISGRQLDEMARLDVSLIVPEKLHKEYPREGRDALLTVGTFVKSLKNVYPQ
ncbi:MAG TPA: type II restriction endonuclease [Anaerolineales bacterium]|nr:type II restriction endonuclease [Anaerolineales bacterium]